MEILAETIKKVEDSRIDKGDICEENDKQGEIEKNILNNEESKKEGEKEYFEEEDQKKEIKESKVNNNDKSTREERAEKLIKEFADFLKNI